MYKPIMSGVALQKTLILADEPIVLNQLLRDPTPPIEEHNRIKSADSPTPESEPEGSERLLLTAVGVDSATPRCALPELM